MWLVVKYKKNELEIFKKSLTKELGEKPIFFTPKTINQRYYKNKLYSFEKNILGNYLMCFHKKFEKFGILSRFKYIKGLQYFLTNFLYNQKEIIKFISYCKKHQDHNGYLSQDFFDYQKIKRG